MQAAQHEPIVIVFPGFTRTADRLKLFVGEVQRSGFDCTAITLAPTYFPVLYMDKRHLRSITRRITVKFPARPLVLVGHSAGAAAATFIASELQKGGADLAGLIYADGVDSPNHLISRYLPRLQGVSIRAVLAPPSACNRHSRLEKYLATQPQVEVRVIPGAGHGDIEGAGIPVYQKMCRDESTVAVAQEFRRALIDDIRAMCQ